MEEKHRELLELHRATFAQVIEVERLYPSLESSDVLTPDDIDEINKQATKTGKVEKLLDLLKGKDNLAFRGLCLALERTYPHLLTVMMVMSLGNDIRLPETRSQSLTSGSEEEVLGRSQNSGETRSQDLTSYTRIIPSYEYDFQETGTPDRSFSGPLSDAKQSGAKHKHHNGRYRGAVNGESYHGDHNRDYDWLKSQCERAMSELQSLKHQQMDSIKRYDAVMKESDTYRQNYKMALGQLQQTRDEVNSIKKQSSELMTDKNRLELEVKNLQKLREEDKQEMAELRKQQRAIVSETGSNEVLNALDMYDRIKKEYDSLREQYADLASQHSTVRSRLENAQVENSDMQKRCEQFRLERDSAILERNGFKQQCTAAIRSWDQVLHERNDLSEKINKITQQRHDALKDMNAALSSQLHAEKELEKVIKDRDSHLREYSLVMSERDQVHKEIEQLQEKLASSYRTIESLSKDKKSMCDEIETLKREIKSALHDRDKSVKERNEVCEKYTDVCSKKAELDVQREELRKDFEMATHERDIARKERHEALQDRDRILRETYERERKQEEMEQVNKETELLKKQIEKLNDLMAHGEQEAEIAKKRRDWAFGERDKIVHERDSIRTLCDNLRRDRDRAVSDLAQALRDYDEMKKQKYEAIKELKEIREKYEFMNEKESRKNQLNSVGQHNHSRDSAIDADLQEWETETLDIEIGGLNVEDLGFELVGGKEDPQSPSDNSIFVSHVTKGSVADGKLKVNDQLLRVNNSDVTNVEKRYALQVLRNRPGVVSMVVRRRKLTLARSWQAIQLNIPPGKDLGIQFDQGLFISRINPGSYAAKEGFLTVGDRIVSVNGRSIENMTPDDLLKLLYQCSSETLMLDVWRQTSPLNSTGSSPVPNGQCPMPSISDSALASPLKSEMIRAGWDQDTSKGSMKNSKTSGSQTDSLDSPSVGRKQKHSKGVEYESKGKRTHVMNKAIEKVENIFRPRIKSQDRHDPDEKGNGFSVSGRPKTMIEDSNVLGEFSFPINPVHPRENSNSSSNQQKNANKRELDTDNTGTWPKCIRGTQLGLNGTLVAQSVPKQRPSLDNVIKRTPDSIPTAKIQPMPPERKQSSFDAAYRHSPQSSDSTITGRYASSSPFPSPLPSPPSKSPPYVPSAVGHNRRSGPTEQTFFSNEIHSQGYKPKSTSRNPPRMPAIPSSMNPGQFELPKHSERITQGRSLARPKSATNSSERKRTSYVTSSVTSPNHYQVGVDPGKLDVQRPFSSRSNNATPEPLSPPFPPPGTGVPAPSQFTDRPPDGPQYPQPSSSRSFSVPNPSNSFGSLSQPASIKQHQVYQAVTTKNLIPYNSPPPVSFLDPVNDSLPPYEWHSSSTPSVDRITPTPSSELGLYPNFTGSSPISKNREGDSPSFPRKGYDNHRVWLPSNSSITSGSLELATMSDHSSSPFPDYNVIPTVSRPMEAIPRRQKPRPGETRTIKIDKTSNIVGISIASHPSGGIFVSSVNENSLAARAGIFVGDQLLEICAINMRNATYDLAARVLHQVGNSLVMLVQYNPDKYNEQNGSSDVSSTNTSPATSPNPSLVTGGGQQKSQLVKSPSSPRSSKYEAQRKVSFKKPNPNSHLGISVVGGNTVGIFIQELQLDSPAYGLQCGDQILEFNGIDFTHATVEQAYLHLQKPCSAVRLRVQYRPSKYSKIRSKRSYDSFYIRAMFHRQVESEGDLGFRKDDILLVEDTMYNSKQGVWYAFLVDDDGHKLKGGTIPSKEKLEDDLISRHSLSESLSLHDSEEIKPARRGSGSARRSFFRRRRHQRTGSKDSRELNSFSDASLNSDSVAGLDDLSLSTYTSVERLECKSIRPVVLIAPLADALIQKLCSESPDKYLFCEPFKIQTSHSSMEQSLKDGNFVDYWQQDDHYLCIRPNDIRDIGDKRIHCLLNVNPVAIERLHRLQLYPIVIFARHKSYKQIKEVKDVQFLQEKISNKNAKDLYEYCAKVEQEYRHLFSATIQGGNLAEMCQQIKNVIATEQLKAVWVPSSFLR